MTNAILSLAALPELFALLFYLLQRFQRLRAIFINFALRAFTAAYSKSSSLSSAWNESSSSSMPSSLSSALYVTGLRALAGFIASSTTTSTGAEVRDEFETKLYKLRSANSNLPENTTQAIRAALMSYNFAKRGVTAAEERTHMSRDVPEDPEHTYFRETNAGWDYFVNIVQSLILFE